MIVTTFTNILFLLVTYPVHNSGSFRFLQNQQSSSEVPNRQSNNLNFLITKTWDGLGAPDNTSISITLSSNDSQKSKTSALEIRVEAPYFNDPQIPDSPPGPLNRLWEYEVVEAFFLNSLTNEYLEIELSPTGHYLILKLNGVRQVTESLLPLDVFQTNINYENNTWTGVAHIPWNYFPAHVDKFNAYAIHKSEPDRVYLSLFPVPNGKFEGPDFHRVQYFGNIDLVGLRSNKL